MKISVFLYVRKIVKCIPANKLIALMTKSRRKYTPIELKVPYEII